MRKNGQSDRSAFPCCPPPAEPEQCPTVSNHYGNKRDTKGKNGYNLCRRGQTARNVKNSTTVSILLRKSIWGIAPLKIKPMKLLKIIQFMPIVTTASCRESSRVFVVTAKMGYIRQHMDPKVNPKSRVQR